MKNEYMGKTPKPKDFYKYWHSQVLMINNLSLDYQCQQKHCLNKYALYYDLTFTSFDGEKIYAKYIRPVHQNKVPVVLDFHRYGERSRGWHHLTRYVALDYAVVAMDCRGQAGFSHDTHAVQGTTVNGHIVKGIDGEVDEMYYRKIYLDGLLLLRIVSQLEGIDKAHMITFGRDQGAAIALVLAALNPSVYKCSMQYPILTDIKGIYELHKDTQLYDGLRYYLRWFDPLHLRIEQIFERLGYIDIIHFADMVSCQTLLATAMLDDIAPPLSQFALYNHLNCRKQHIIYEKHGHELINSFEDEYLKFIKIERNKKGAENG